MEQTPQQWEYLCITAKTDYLLLMEQMVELGGQGWEFCAIFNGGIFIFKRPEL